MWAHKLMTKCRSPLKGHRLLFGGWVPKLTVLKSMQVNKKNSPGPAQAQNCCTFGWEGLLFTLGLFFILKKIKHPSPTCDIIKQWKRWLHLWRWLIIGTGSNPEGLGLGFDSWEIIGSTVGSGTSLGGRDSEAEFKLSWYFEAACKQSWTDLLTFS